MHQAQVCKGMRTLNQLQAGFKLQPYIKLCVHLQLAPGSVTPSTGLSVHECSVAIIFYQTDVIRHGALARQGLASV